MLNTQHVVTSPPRAKNVWPFERKSHARLSSCSGPKEKTLLVAMFYILHSSLALRLVEMGVPGNAPYGRDVTLTCDVDPEGEELYGIKWFREEQEFYRFQPTERPDRLYFPLKGIKVDMQRSTNTSVVLTNLNYASSGIYQCEASADAPNFTTVSAQAFMGIGDFYSCKEPYSIPGSFVLIFTGLATMHILL